MAAFDARAAALPTTDRERLRAYIAEQEHDGWLSDERQVGRLRVG